MSQGTDRFHDEEMTLSVVELMSICGTRSRRWRLNETGTASYSLRLPQHFAQASCPRRAPTIGSIVEQREIQRTTEHPCWPGINRFSSLLAYLAPIRAAVTLSQHERVKSMSHRIDAGPDHWMAPIFKGVVCPYPILSV